MRVHDFFENKIKGADGKACWDGYRYNGTKDGKDSCVKVDEARADVNFDAEDLKRLERISDLETLKTQAFALISKPSAKPMKPEKVSWFKQALAGKSNKIAVIKMMYDLMLSGEGNSVIGSKNSMNPNSYRKVFNSATSEGVTENAEELGIGDDVIISGNVEFNGKTGVIDSFGQDKRFVIVNLYNHGKHSFHSSDVSANDYADSDEEEARMSEAYQNDESNLLYIYDKTDGRLKQKMIANLDEPQARSMGYRDSIDAALRVANIIRSKFDAKKFVQKQGNQWVPVYPFGQQGVGEAANPAQQAAIAIAKKKQDAKEAFASPPPFKDMIASIYQPKVGDSIRTRKGGQIPGTVEKVADHNGIEYCWFRHPEGKLYKTPCSNVMRG